MMELEDLDNINKNDFLPLLPLNIKQELLDNNGSITTAPNDGGEVVAGGNGEGAGGCGGNDGGASGSSSSGNGTTDVIGSGNGETANICDSVEKQVS